MFIFVLFWFLLINFSFIFVKAINYQIKLGKNDIFNNKKKHQVSFDSVHKVEFNLFKINKNHLFFNTYFCVPDVAPGDGFLGEQNGFPLCESE